jgi:hypothetical protein
MKYALPVYAALRNLMTDPYMQEINRGYKTQPGLSDKEYVQWQRGATTKTPLPLMQSWVDTTLAHNNIWLVLVFHGIDGMGYEALPSELLDTYFRYIKNHENDLWVATFSDAAKYMRERMHATVSTDKKEDRIIVHLQQSLDSTVYDVPLTLKTYLPDSWKNVEVDQAGNKQQAQLKQDNTGKYILYDIMPGNNKIEIVKQ